MRHGNCWARSGMSVIRRWLSLSAAAVLLSACASLADVSELGKYKELIGVECRTRTELSLQRVPRETSAKKLLGDRVLTLPQGPSGPEVISSEPVPQGTVVYARRAWRCRT